MGLNDLMNEIKQDPNNFLGDEATENKVLRQVMTLVEDKISEVKNQAVKWYVPPNIPNLCSLCLNTFSLGQLIKIIRESQMDFVVDKLIDFSSNKDEELRDISSLGSMIDLEAFLFFLTIRPSHKSSKIALKTITAELPLESQIAPKACAKLSPKLLHQLSNASTAPVPSHCLT